MIGLLLPQGNPLRVLVIGAHGDDVEIGAGGTVLELGRQAPALELTAFVATSTPERAAECRAGLTALAGPASLSIEIGELPDSRLPAHFDAVKDRLAGLAVGPWDLVLAPHAEDAHQDHALLGRLVPTAFRDHLILHYEVPKWDGDLGSLRPNLYVPLSAEQVQRKWDILDQHYASQRAHDWWDREIFAGLARLRGMECRSRYAEAFRVDKMLLHGGCR
ncbi:MAG: PIG-L family deacetylase [Actinobacteria bacterium]|nr:PIG-L family deacetylase [Actinomycetota bacterium]